LGKKRIKNEEKKWYGKKKMKNFQAAGENIKKTSIDQGLRKRLGGDLCLTTYSEKKERKRKRKKTSRSSKVETRQKKKSRDSNIEAAIV